MRFPPQAWQVAGNDGVALARRPAVRAACSSRILKVIAFCKDLCTRLELAWRRSSCFSWRNQSMSDNVSQLNLTKPRAGPHPVCFLPISADPLSPDVQINKYWPAVLSGAYSVHDRPRSKQAGWRTVVRQLLLSIAVHATASNRSCVFPLAFDLSTQHAEHGPCRARARRRGASDACALSCSFISANVVSWLQQPLSTDADVLLLLLMQVLQVPPPFCIPSPEHGRQKAAQRQVKERAVHHGGSSNFPAAGLGSV
jgi:hypothetical protein